jgi:hypothetical protein
MAEVLLIEVMRKLEIQYIFTWKCHNETLCTDILNEQKCLFSQKQRRATLIRSCLGVGSSGSGGYKEMMKGEYGTHIMFSCMKMEKMRPAETILRMGGRG